MSESPGQSSRCSGLRLSLACDLAEVRPATLAVRGFLTEHKVSEQDVAACELAMAEACNNAISYAAESSRRDPIKVEVMCHPAVVELRIFDHTSGFRWPDEVALPDPENENGRGLFLIQALTGNAEYFRGESGNILVIRRPRAAQPAPRFRATTWCEATQRGRTS